MSLWMRLYESDGPGTRQTMGMVAVQILARCNAQRLENPFLASADILLQRQSVEPDLSAVKFHPGLCGPAGLQLWLQVSFDQAGNVMCPEQSNGQQQWQALTRSTKGLVLQQLSPVMLICSNFRRAGLRLRP